MNVKEARIVMLKAMDIQVGDTVKVLRVAEETEIGDAVDSQNDADYLNGEYCVTEVDYTDGTVELDGEDEWFAPQVLEVTKRAERPELPTKDQEHEAYVKLQEAFIEGCNLKPGDEVEVVRKAKDHENGWLNVWNSKMDAYIGQRTIVQSVGGLTGIRCVDTLGTRRYFSGKPWDFPFFCLRKTRSAEEIEAAKKQPEVVETVDDSETEPATPSVPKEDTQAAKVLDYLKANSKITPLKAIGIFQITRLAAVIHDLKKRGYQIETKNKSGASGRYAEYRLVA